jgi:DKNYY family
MNLLKLSIIAITLLLTACSTGYQNDSKAVYYKYWNEGSGSRKDRLDADPKTFTVLKNERYAKDNSHVFLKAK